MADVTIVVGTDSMGQDSDPARTARAFAAYVREQVPGAYVSVGDNSSSYGIERDEVNALWDAFCGLPQAEFRRLGAIN